MLRHKLPLFSASAFFICAFGFIQPAAAATLTLSGGDSATIGQTISVPLFVSTEGSEVLNAVSAEIRFPSSLLTLQSISKTGSVMSFWAEEPSYSNSNGTAVLQGIVPNPGWNGQRGTIVTFVFKVKASGSATISFSSASVLANDGLGTNILSKAYSKTLSFGDSVPQATSPALTSGAPLAPVLTSSTHPDPSMWYNDANPLFSWKVPANVTAVRLLYDKNPVSSPNILYNPAIDRKQLSGVRDGTYYFHAQFQNANGWGAISHMRFQVDTVPPKAFTVKVVRESNGKNPQPILSFETTDTTSGIDHYTVSVGDTAPITVTKSQATQYPLPIEKSGEETIVIDAYDKAGNTTTEAVALTIAAIESPTITTYGKQFKADDLFTVSGTTYPEADVEVTIKSSRGDAETELTTADALGNFSIIWSRHLDAGTFSFTVVAKSASGATSLPTEPRTFVVAGTPLAQWGSTALGYLLFAFAMVAAIAFIVGVGYILWYRLGHLRRRLKHMTVRSGRGVQHDFEKIMDDLHSLAALLHKTKQSRQLTKEEDVILETLKLHLKKMEDDILSRLEQIDDEAG